MRSNLDQKDAVVWGIFVFVLGSPMTYVCNQVSINLEVAYVGEDGDDEVRTEE
jgi:hypothetical protein